MRKQGTPSQIAKLAVPLIRLFDAGWQQMHWWIVIMVILYCFSGITIIKPDEVAVILRWGHLVGSTAALQQHGPGMLFGFPRPIDEVIRVKVKHVWEVRIQTLLNASDWSDGQTLDPLSEGYALTGDQNIVHVDMVARYRIREPAEWALSGPKSEEILRIEVTAAMVRTLGEMGVDRVLSDGRKILIATAARRAQAGLDKSHCGLELSSLELTRLSPPVALVKDFEQVQSAYIGAETKKKEALAFAQSLIPNAQAETDSALQTARADSSSELARAQGDAEAFLALEREYHANRIVMRERLYRDAVERAISSAARVEWVPPPAGGHYQGLRITIQPTQAGTKPKNQNNGDSSTVPLPNLGEDNE